MSIEFISEPRLVVGLSLERSEGAIALIEALLPALSISLPCGNTKHIRSLADLPLDDDECGCGTLFYPHFFVKWHAPTRIPLEAI